MPASSRGRDIEIHCSNGEASTIRDVLVGDVMTGSRQLSGELIRPREGEEACPKALPLVREFRIKTKGIQTKKARTWLAELPLGRIDRMEMDLLLEQWKLWDVQLKELDEQIASRQREHPTAAILATLPGAGAFSSLALASRIGPIERFARPGSLANYWGLTPGCRNSGEATDRLGSITKEGSAMARSVLGQMVLHVLRKDPYMRSWYSRIKKRRGAKIARVAVMRRLATIIWHMVKYRQPYVIGGPPHVGKMRATAAALSESVGTSARARLRTFSPTNSSEESILEPPVCLPWPRTAEVDSRLAGVDTEGP